MQYPQLMSQGEPRALLYEGEIEPSALSAAPGVPDEGHLHGRDGRDRVSTQPHIQNCGFIYLFLWLVVP